MRLKLFPKIALLLICLAIVPALIVGWQTYSLNKEHIETSVLDLNVNLANSLSKRIDRYLNGTVGKMRAFIEALRIQGVISTESLKAFVDSNDEFISIAFINMQGRELLKAAARFASPEEKKLKEHSNDSVFVSYLSQKTNRDEFYEPKYEFSFKNNDPRLAIVFPNNAQNFSQGAFYIVVSLTELWREIVSEGAGVGGGGREAFVVDERGALIAHSNPSIALNNVSVQDHPIVSEALSRRSTGSKEYKDEKGRLLIGAYATVKSSGWISVIQQSKETAYVAIYETRKSALQIILLSILMAAGVAFLFAKNLSQPIFSLIEGARRVTRGEFDHSVQINTNDEISDLARTFNEMVNELKRYNELQVDRIIEEKTKTESVIFSIADGIILTDREGTIQLVNDRAIKIFSLNNAKGEGSETGPEQRWIGKNLFHFLPDPKVKDALKALLSKPDSPLLREITTFHGEYQQHYQLSSELVYTQKTGKNLGVVTVIHDVTLERQMDELKESFLQSITHDLRNPMTSITGFLKFLMDGVAGPINERQREMLKTMDRASGRLLAMINDILDIAKVEAGKLEIELMPVLLPILIENVRALNQPMAEKKSIQLRTALPAHVPEESLTVRADENQLERLVGNLVANAVKFTPYEGTVTVALEDFSDRIQISVTDNGPGIPQDDLGKIFEKFQQVKGQKQGGTGLGLTICKYLVELHCGKIWVESELAKGSRFVFWVPKGLKRSQTGKIICEKIVA